GVSAVGRVHRLQQPEEAGQFQERRASGRGGETAAVEAEVNLEEEHGAAQEAGHGELRLRPAKLLPELRRRPLLLRPPAAFSDSV
ncbi:unnamed protein product, partial [Urochloa humidicola]